MPTFPPPGPRLVLASTSRWRQEVCAQVGLEVEALPPGVDESVILRDEPHATALARARAKADALAGPDRVVIGSDQVCHLDGISYGKPKDPEDHRAQLRALRGRAHTLSNGVSIVAPGCRRDWVTDVRVRLRGDLTDEEIGNYVASGEGEGCAGGYRAEGRGAWLVEAVEGDWFAVLGLPIYEVLTALRALGWRPDAERHTSARTPQGSTA